MHVFRWLLVGTACCLSGPTPTRIPRPHFLDLPMAGTPVKGHVALRIGGDPPSRLGALLLPPPAAKKVRVTVYLDGSPLLNEAAPLTYDWDTNALRNGPHTLLMRWIDPTNQNEQTLDKVTVMVANATGMVANATGPVANASLPPPPAVVQGNAVPPGAVSPVERPSGVDDSAPVAPPGRRVLATLHPQQSRLAPVPNAHPLEVKATALHLIGNQLCIGLPDGSLTLYDCKTRKGQTLRLPRPTGKVVAIQGDARALYWLTDPTSAPASHAAAPAAQGAAPLPETESASSPPALRQLFLYRPAERTLTTFYLAEANAFASTTRVTAWQSGVALFGERANGILDPKTGEILDLESELPVEATGNMSRFSALYLTSEGADGLLVRAETHLDDTAGANGNVCRLQLALWRRHADTWTSAGTFLSAATDTWRLVPLAITPQGVCSIENKVGLYVGLKAGTGQSAALPLPFRDYFQAKNAQVALAGRHLWTTDGSVLYHTDLDTTASDAFLPWNEKGLHIQAFAPEPDGVWLATERDVRHLALKHPDASHGYAGLLKFRLGPEAATPMQPEDQKLASLIAAWQGTAYQWGGSSRQGTDCSGFVMAVHQQLGISLPKGTVALRECTKGPRIHDELQYGDVLVYPGHCAIYIGNGKTAETVDKAVSYASVWYHDDVVVRRFLHAPLTSAPPFDSNRSSRHPGRSLSTH
jgi:hypothetical protein